MSIENGPEIALAFFRVFGAVLARISIGTGLAAHHLGQARTQGAGHAAGLRTLARLHRGGQPPGLFPDDQVQHPGRRLHDG
jgi:hypothetical protein